MRLVALRHDATRLRELLETLGCMHKALHHEICVQWESRAIYSRIDSRSRMDRGDQVSRVTRRSAA